MQCCCFAGHNVNDDAGMAAREPINDGRNEARGQKMVASDPHFSGRRVREELNVLHAFPQLVEDRDGSPEQRATVRRRLHAVSATIEKANADRVL